MTYKSLQEIKEAFPEPENETTATRNRRLKNKQAINRLNERQASSQSQSTTTTARKQKSRATLTDEQRINIQEQNRIESHQTRYTTQQEQSRTQFLKIGCCNIDDYIESIIEGNEIENNRHKFKGMNNICNHCYALKWENEPKGFCCLNGQVVIAILSSTPPYLYILLTNNDPNSDEPYVN
ncbi:unnamed protein product [Rhizophagus irregularis]|nr:unnamed protein product [Rhizophagus irregularis]